MPTHKGQYVTHTKVKLDKWNDGHTPTCMFDRQQGKFDLCHMSPT